MKNCYFNELKDRHEQFIACFDALMWEWKDKPNKGRVLSFLINADMRQEEDGRRNKYGYFMCTSSYISFRTFLEEHSVGRALKELEKEGYIKTKVVNKQRWIKINRKNIEDIFTRFEIYRDESKWNDICDDEDIYQFISET